MIYFLRRSDGAIKVGTTENYHMRLSQLIAKHGDLELLGLMEGNRDIEQQLHRQFAGYRIGRTEFFRDHDELRTYIDVNTRLEIPERVSVPIRFTDRVPVTKETRDDLREFAKGLGVTYDTAIRFLLHRTREEREALFMAGHRLRFDVPEELRDEDGETSAE